jgi:hypothetical protein
MDSDLIVLTASTVGPNHPESGTLALYLSQLEAAGIDHYCEPLSEFPANGGSLSYKIKGLRDRVVRYLHYDKLVFTDGHDMQFFGNKEDVISKIPDAGVLLGAERNCYPEPELAKLIHNPLPHKYVNGGWLAGSPESFLAWLEAIERHPHFNPVTLDQAFFNRLLAENDPLIQIDDRTELVYCFFGEAGSIHDLQFDEQGLPVNTLTLTHPAWTHANGKWPSDHIWARRNK